MAVGFQRLLVVLDPIYAASAYDLIKHGVRLIAPPERGQHMRARVDDVQFVRQIGQRLIDIGQGLGMDEI